jgi:hypothetical protein
MSNGVSSRPDHLKHGPRGQLLRQRFGRKRVPAGLVQILDRDLKTAGFAKRDDRGRTIVVHALRTTFGAPRTAQAAMRHSSIDLTMNTYTDPKLLDVQGAVDSLPTLTLPTDLPTRKSQTLNATGTDDRGGNRSCTNSRQIWCNEFISSHRITDSRWIMRGRSTLSNPIKNPASQGMRAGEGECTWQNSNLRPHPCQGCALTN